MADLGGVFNAEEVAPQGDRSPIPAGSYKCVAIKSEWKATNAGTGRYLEFTWQVIEGDHKGRMAWSRLNLENPSSQAVNIARSELSSICRATGKMSPRQTEELHDIPIVIELTVRRRADNGDPTNEVKGYKSVSEAAKAQPVAAVASEGNKPNWM